MEIQTTDSSFTEGHQETDTKNNSDSGSEGKSFRGTQPQ